MFNTFAHAGHVHTEPEETAENTQVKTHTEQAASASDFSALPIIAGGSAAAIAGVLLIALALYSLSKKPTKNKK